MTPVEMPKANENLTEATLDRWIVKEGDTVKLDQPLCDIITDKAKFELPAPAAGTILKRLTPERALLPVGYILCVIGAPGEAVSADLDDKNAALLKAHRGATTAIPSAGGASADIGGAASGVRATPAARRVAKELGIDLAKVAADLKLSAPVTEKDIKAWQERNK